MGVGETSYEDVKRMEVSQRCIEMWILALAASATRELVTTQTLNRN